MGGTPKEPSARFISGRPPPAQSVAPQLRHRPIAPGGRCIRDGSKRSALDRFRRPRHSGASRLPHILPPETPPIASRARPPEGDCIDLLTPQAPGIARRARADHRRSSIQGRLAAGGRRIRNSRLCLHLGRGHLFRRHPARSHPGNDLRQLHGRPPQLPRRRRLTSVGSKARRKGSPSRRGRSDVREMRRRGTRYVPCSP